MIWLLPAIIACLAGSAILVWVYGFLYLQYRERHIGLWTWGWVFYTLRFTLMLLDLTWLPWIDMQHLVHVCVMLSGYFLFLGTAEFVKKPVSRIWHLGLGLGLLWIPVSHLADWAFFLTNLPIFTFYGLTSIWTGLLILRSPELARGGGRLLTGVSFILWGLHKIDYLFMQPLAWFAPWGFLLSACFSFTVALGMLLIYFQRVRQALQLSQKKFQAMFDQSFQLVGLLDTQGTLLEVNRTALDIKETTSQKEIGKPFWETIWWKNIPGGQERIRQAVRQAAGGQLVRFEVTDPLDDGRALHIDFSLKPVRNEAGEVLFLIPEGRDITEHKQLEQLLETSKARLENAQRIAHLGNWDLDIADGTASWSAEVYRIFGLDPGQFEPSYEAFLKAVHPEDRAAVQAAVTASLQQQMPYDIEHRVICPDGRLRHVRERAEISFDDQGQPLRMLGTVLDITEHKQAELALRASEEKYLLLYRQFQGLLDGIPDLLLLFDPNLRVVWANRSAHQMGGELRVLEGADCHRLQQQWGIPCDVFMLIDAFSWGRPEEGRVATPDGSSWGVKAFPLRDEQNTVSHVILWASDITEKSRLRDEAQRATRLASLGELAAGMAHEINNPNGLILLNLPLIIDCLGDALKEIEATGSEPELGGLAFSRVRVEVPEQLLEVQQAARRIKRIVDDLKDFVRQERSDAGETFNLNEVVQAATRLLANPIKTATDRFVLRCADDLPPVRGSFQRIEQVVVNLVMNACQALPERQRRLQLGTAYDPSHGMVLLQVEDEGIGIQPDDLPHLTDPFFTTRRDQGGTGLGLSVSARIVREHDGQLEFNSTPGRGTIVTLRLPAAPREESP